MTLGKFENILLSIQEEEVPGALLVVVFLVVQVLLLAVGSGIWGKGFTMHWYQDYLVQLERLATTVWKIGKSSSERYK